MLTACPRLPFSCQQVPKTALKFSWVTSGLAVTQDWQISQGSCWIGLLEGEMQAGLTGQLQCSDQAWRVTKSIFLPPHHEGLPAQGSPSLKGAAWFCSSVCFPIPSRISVDIKSCSRVTGDEVPVADELIAGVRLRREMAEAMVSGVGTDRLHPAKIVPTATPTGAQLCVVTLGDTSRNTSRWKQLVQIIFQIIRHFFLAARQRVTGRQKGQRRVSREEWKWCSNGIRQGHRGHQSLNVIFESLGIPQMSLENRIWVSQVDRIFLQYCPESISLHYCNFISAFGLGAYRMCLYKYIINIYIYIYSCSKWAMEAENRQGQTEVCIFCAFLQ